MTAIRLCPSDTRCSTALSPPAQLVAPTDGMPGGAAPGGQVLQPTVVGPGPLPAVHRRHRDPGPGPVGDLLHAGQDCHRPRTAEVDEDQVDEVDRLAWRRPSPGIAPRSQEFLDGL